MSLSASRRTETLPSTLSTENLPLQSSAFCNVLGNVVSLKRYTFGGSTSVHRSDRTVTDSRVIDASKFFTTLDANQRLKRERVLFSDTKCDARSEDEYSVLQINYPGSGNNSQFTYDGLGRMVEIVESVSGSVTSTKQFVCCFSDCYESRDASGNVISRYFSLGQTISGTNYFFSKDHLGSIKDVSNSAGVLQTEYSYDPTGRTIKLYGSFDSDFQYAGYYKHSPSGLYITQTRFYNPASSRFLSRDPIGEQGARNASSVELANIASSSGNLLTNSFPLGSSLQMSSFIGTSDFSSNGGLYTYVGNSPINFIDPSGLQGLEAFTPWIKPWMICAVAVGFTGLTAFAAVTALTRNPQWGGVAAVAFGGAVYLGLPDCHCHNQEQKDNSGGGDNKHNSNAPARFFQ